MFGFGCVSRERDIIHWEIQLKMGQQHLKERDRLACLLLRSDGGKHGAVHDRREKLHIKG